MGDSKTASLRTGAVKPPKDGMKKVLVLYVSGCTYFTTTQTADSAGLKNKLYQFCRSDPAMNDVNFLTPSFKEVSAFCVLPTDNDSKVDRVAYLIWEYEKLIDSCNVTPSHWKIIAKDIQSNFEDFDGFVIIHGRDTMTFTASALSFMFENLSKPVVLTGASRPILDSRSDVKNNLRMAISVAAKYPIPEVMIFFKDRLLRGNRAIERGAGSFFAFDTLNVPPLLQIGVCMKDQESLMKPVKKCKLVVHSKLNPNVAFLRVYPGLPVQIIKACFEPPMEGVVMQNYGLGDIPTDRRDLTNAMSQAIDRDVIIASCTQCPIGSVAPVATLGTGEYLEALGVILLGDMTAEAAITKMKYVLSKKKLSLEEKKRLMTKPIRGEMSES